jgi:hypothetical protein
VIATHAERRDPTESEILAMCREIREQRTPRQLKRYTSEYVPRVFKPVEPERERDF